MNLAIGRLWDQSKSNSLGTAFAISEFKVLTAFHCVGDLETGDINHQQVIIRFLPSWEVAADFTAGSAELDYAILTLQSTLSSEYKPIPLLTDTKPLEEFRILGYPAHSTLKNLDITPIIGKVTDPYGSIFRGVPAIALESSTAKDRLPLYGMSGAPVMVGTPEAAIGLVKWNPQRPEGQLFSLSGIVYACPTRSIVEEHPEFKELCIARIQALEQPKLLPSQEEQKRDRQNLINRVYSVCIDDYLHNSVHQKIYFSLGFEQDRDALLKRRRKTAFQPIDNFLDKSIHTIFEDSGRSLLIRGAPGSGKTITLLQIAEQCLLEAKRDHASRIPVFFYLSKWANKPKQQLADWLEEELSENYNIARETSRDLLKKNKLILLLDGLDEVNSDCHNDCIDAINKFIEAHSTEIVVSSRIDDLEHLSSNLNLSFAIKIQPLTQTQVDDYLSRDDIGLRALRSAIQDDPVFQQLASIPAFLSMMVVAYRGKSPAELKPMTLADRHNHLFDTYVKHVFEERPLTYRDQALKWLGNLAFGLSQHNQTIFYIEALQPTWLSDPSKYLYELLCKLIFRLTIGLIIGLSVGLVFGLIGGLVYGLIVGFISGLIGGKIYDYEKKLRNPRFPFVLSGQSIVLNEQHHWSFSRIDLLRHLKEWLGAALQIGLTGVLVVEFLSFLVHKGADIATNELMLIDGLIFGLIGGLIFGLIGGLMDWMIDRLIGGISVVRFIYTSQARPKVLSPKQIGLGDWLLVWLIFGLILGLFFGLIFGLIFSLESSLDRLLISWLIGGVIILFILTWPFAFLTLCRIALRDYLTEAITTTSTLDEVRISPNQGIRASSRTAIRTGLLGGLVFWLVDLLYCCLIFGFYFGLLDLDLLDGLELGFFVGLISGTINGLRYGLIPWMLEYGGGTVIQHYILRFLLAHEGILPFPFLDRRLTSYLDEMVSRKLLYRIGGGWIFIHRTMIEYFEAKYADYSGSIQNS